LYSALLLFFIHLHCNVLFSFQQKKPKKYKIKLPSTEIYFVYLNRKPDEIFVLSAVVVPIFDRFFRQISISERKNWQVILQDLTAGRTLDDPVDDVVSERVQVGLDAQVRRRQEPRVSALNDEPAVVDDSDERLGGSDLQLGAHEVLPVADPQHDPAEKRSEMFEEDFLFVEIGLSELEDWSRGVVDANEFTVWDGVMVVPDVFGPSVDILNLNKKVSISVQKQRCTRFNGSSE
jgi:hypothetical protein